MLKLFTLSRKQSVTNDATHRETRPAAPVPQDQSYWLLRRRAPLEHESKVSGWTRSWLDALPEDVRPLELASCHAHVANRLALSWRDPLLTEQEFEDLLVNRRAGRKGFSAAVTAELLRLREHHDQRRGATGRPPHDERTATSTITADTSRRPSTA
jgi:hypothetical protein